MEEDMGVSRTSMMTQGAGGRVLMDGVMVGIAVDLSVFGDGEEELELWGELLFRVEAVGEVYPARGRV